MCILEPVVCFDSCPLSLASKEESLSNMLDATDVGLTIAAQKAFAATCQVGTLIKVTWVSPDAPGIVCEWSNGKVTEKPTADSCVVIYPGQGEGTYDFPVPPADGKVRAAIIMVVAVRASMRLTAQMTSQAVNILDMAQWQAFLRDRMSASILIDKFKAEHGILQEPDVTSKTGRAFARRTHYFEKKFLLEVLYQWMMSYLGPNPAYNQLPQREVAHMLLCRLDAFKVEAEGGSVSKYMESMRRHHDPKDMQAHRKAAMSKKDKGEGSDPET